MSGTRNAVPGDAQPGVVFVVGMYESGTDLVHTLLRSMGLRSVSMYSKDHTDALSALNGRLLEAAGGSRRQPPEVAPRDVARILRAFTDEAQACLDEALLSPDGAADSGLVVWSDPANSFLAPFWAQMHGIRPAVLLVHRDPQDVVNALTAGGVGREEALDQWDRHNRASIVQVSQWPSMTMSFEGLMSRPKETVHELGEFAKQCGLVIDANVEGAIEFLDGLSVDKHPGSDRAPVRGQYGVLARVLDQLDGNHFDDYANPTGDGGGLLEAVSSFYGEDYYGVSYDRSGVAYRRGEKVWEDFFGGIAGSIVERLNPRTALDMGCAIGMLVEALRDRGVDAHGIDVSVWAINQVPDALRPYCQVGSITDEIVGRFDLITCFEMLEHLPPSFAPGAVANLCRHADAVLFSSMPDDFDEPTHLNVESGGYWAQLFFRQGFVRDVDFDASFLAPHAVLFRKGERDTEALIDDYERGLSNVSSVLGARLAEAVGEHARLSTRFNELAEDFRELGSESERLANAVLDTERRRTAETWSAFETVRQYEHGQRRLAALVESRDREIEAIHQTKIYRYSVSLRRIYGRIRRSRRPAAPVAESAHLADGTYALWIEQYDTLDDAARRAIRDRVAQLAHQPLISIIMPVYNAPAEFLRAAVESVRAQLYDNWELCIADDCSSEAHVAEILAEYQAIDTRIKVVRRDANGHIAAASNSALSLATGDWVGCLDHDDTLAEHALALVAIATADEPDAGIVYSDEDKLDGAGARQDPYFKPDFDPLLLVGQNYINHLCLFRRHLVIEAGGYREGYEGSQDWDLLLRVSELVPPDKVIHIPHVLYHWRAHSASTASVLSSKPYAVDAGRRAVVDHLARTGRSGRVTRIPVSGHNRVTWDLPDPAPLVSLIIPTRDGTLLERCLESLFAFTTYPNFEITVVDNSSRTLPTLAYLRAHDDRVKVIRDERPFNYSAINNAAVAQSSGEIVCLLNDDTEVIAGDWLSELVGQVLQPGVGAAGAKLYYDDGRIQHAGVILGMLGVAGHSYRLFDRLSSGYFGRLHLAQHLSGVTAACMVVRREAWDQVRGLDEVNLPIAFNDVDFGIRLREAGWGIVWSPYAELFHHESVSRGPDDVGPRAAEFAREAEYVQKRWGPEVLRHDPYYNPNLSIVAEDFSLAWPPRVSYP